MVKAGGEKGSEVCRCTLRTFFADNADPRALQLEFTLDSSSLASLSGAVERGFGMGSKKKDRHNNHMQRTGTRGWHYSEKKEFCDVIRITYIHCYLRRRNHDKKRILLGYTTNSNRVW